MQLTNSTSGSAILAQASTCLTRKSGQKLFFLFFSLIRERKVTIRWWNEESVNDSRFIASRACRLLMARFASFSEWEPAHGATPGASCASRPLFSCFQGLQGESNSPDTRPAAHTSEITEATRYAPAIRRYLSIRRQNSRTPSCKTVHEACTVSLGDIVWCVRAFCACGDVERCMLLCGVVVPSFDANGGVCSICGLALASDDTRL